MIKEDELIIYDITWSTQTAGPSPDNNKRTEIFLFGCDKAIKGNPCKGCFNKQLWDNSIATKSQSIRKIFKTIQKHSPNRYITISGGEPTDNPKPLLELLKLLKNHDYHVLMYTWRKYKDLIIDEERYELLDYIDILIDGEYNEDERLYLDNHTDGFLSSIGSGNQKIYDLKTYDCYFMKDLESIKLLEKDDQLLFITKE